MKTFPTRVVVIGGGRMGIGIAHVFAAHGSAVTLVEPHDAAGAMEARRREAIELAVEAVPEVFEVKCDVLAGLEKALPRAVLATNTSSSPVTEMGAVLNDPATLIGTHFFNPVPASALVEVVRQPSNSDELVAAVAVGVCFSVSKRAHARRRCHRRRIHRQCHGTGLPASDGPLRSSDLVA